LSTPRELAHSGLNERLVHGYQKFSATVYAPRLGEQNYLTGRVVYGLPPAVRAFDLVTVEGKIDKVAV